MKQRLLLALLVLFASVGMVEASIKITVPKGESGSLRFTQATGSGVTAISVTQGENSLTISNNSCTINANTTSDLEYQIDGSVAALNIDVKVSSVTLESAYQLTSLTIKEGSNLGESLTFDNNIVALRTITAENCGLTKLPPYLASLPAGATLDFKNNRLTKIASSADGEFGNLLTKEDVKIYLEGNQLYSLPKTDADTKATIIYGKQKLVLKPTDTDPTLKANDWFNIYTFINSKISNYLLANNIDASILNVTWNNGKTFEKGTDSEGLKYRFWNGKTYEDGTFTGAVKINNDLAYDFTVEVDKAATNIQYENNPKGGTLTITKNNSEISNGGEVTNGDQLTLITKPNDGFKFKSLNVKGLDKDPIVENVYKVNITRDENGVKDIVSAAATFEAGVYALNIDAITNGKGSYRVINVTEGNKELTTTTANVAYGDNIKIEVDPVDGNTPRVKLNDKEISLTESGNLFTYEFSIEEVSNTVEIRFEENATAKLTIKEPREINIETIVNGKQISYNGDDYTNELPILSTVNITFKSADASSLIQTVLMNARELDKVVDKDGNVSVSFKIPQGGAIVQVIRNNTTDITIVPIKVEDNTQKYTYDSKDHDFEFITKPADLTGFELTYSQDQSNKDNYVKTKPNKVGTYYVKITREADEWYKAVENTDYKVEIEKATPVITKNPKVTINRVFSLMFRKASLKNA